MNLSVTLTPKQLTDFLLNVAVIRPVFIWGPPGIGKSSLVEKFAEDLGLPCVSMLGSQLAPEDIIGVPMIEHGVSRFYPPAMIAREEPYCLFLDELNACSNEVQKAFYSLIHERRVGEYCLPEGSIVIGAGNRAQDSAIVKPMSSALINRMVHIGLKASHRDWLEWAKYNDIHPLIIEYITLRPDHLFTQPPKTEEPFSSPRSWHMFSDALNEYGKDLGEDSLSFLANGCLTSHHAVQFLAFYKQIKNKYRLNKIMNGEATWPSAPEERDVLYFLAQSFKGQLMKTLPHEKINLSENQKLMVHSSKKLIKNLSEISLEIAQMVVVEEQGETLPPWFMVEIVRDLPRLAAKKK